MTALESLQTRLKNFKVNYTYDPLFSYEENRGSFVIQRLNMQVGYYAEEVMPEWDPDPESKHLGAGKKTDWENSTCVFELKRNPKANNGSSKKGDVPKLAKDADLKGKTPIYAYWEDRKKNDYPAHGVRHLHGSALFEFLGVENHYEQYQVFLNDINNIKIMIKEELTKKFDEKFQSFSKSTV